MVLWVIECYSDCRLISFKDIDWESRILSELSKFISPPRVLGVLSKVLVFKRIQLANGASKGSSEELQRLHGWLRIRRHQETPISKVIWRLADWLLKNWRPMVVSRNSCNNIVIKQSYSSESPWWRRFPWRWVDVSQNEDERVAYYKSRCHFSSISSLILIDCVFVCLINCWSRTWVWSRFVLLNFN